MSSAGQIGDTAELSERERQDLLTVNLSRLAEIAAIVQRAAGLEQPTGPSQDVLELKAAIEQDLDRFAGRVRLWQALQLDYFAGWTFDTFLTDTPARRKAHQTWLKQLLPGIKQGSWAMVTGPYSTGKTHLAYATAHDVVLGLGRRALVLNWVSFIEAYKDSWDRSKSGSQQADQATGADLFVQARDAWLLIIDDFDKELPLYETVQDRLQRPYNNGGHVAWWLRQLYRLLDDRYRLSRRESRPTVLIANQPWSHVHAIIRWMGGTAGGAALDRLERIGARALDFDLLRVEPWRDEPIF